MAIPQPIRDAVETWQAATLTLLGQRFSLTLDRAVVALGDRAEKSTDSKRQSAYFHAHRELKRQRGQLLRRFDESLANRINALPADGVGRPSLRSGELKLVTPNTFERLVVLQNLGDRADQQYHDLLYELGHRLSVLHHGNMVLPAYIPGSPAQLLASFDDATHRLNIKHSAWQALAAMFDIKVLRNLDRQYRTLNDSLREAGVLPDLRLPSVTESDTAATPAPSAPAGHRLDSVSELERIRSLIAAGKPPLTGRQPEPTPAAGIAALIENHQIRLVEMLPEHGLFDPGPDGMHIGQEQLADTRQALVRQRNAVRVLVGAGRLAPHDAATLDIVGALFESLLDEDTLGMATRALLSHLQTPYLAIALREAEGLSASGHPARQLLDEMIRAGEFWVDSVELCKGVFPTLRDIVERFARGPTPTRQVLEQQRALLIRQMGELRRRRDLRSARVTEAEISRDRLERAKQHAEQQINRLLLSVPLCEPCQSFLTGPWQDYLTLLLVRNDGQPGGPGWRTALALGDQLSQLSHALGRAAAPPAQLLDALHLQLTRSVGHLVPHYQQDIDALVQALRDGAASRHQPVSATRPRPSPTTTRPGPVVPAVPPCDAERIIGDALRQQGTGTTYRVSGLEGRPTRLLTLTWYNPENDQLLLVDQQGNKAESIPVPRMARLMHLEMARPANQNQRPSFVRGALRALRQRLENPA